MIPGVDTVERLARALGVSPCWLAHGQTAPPLHGPDGGADNK